MGRTSMLQPGSKQGRTRLQSEHDDQTQESQKAPICTHHRHPRDHYRTPPASTLIMPVLCVGIGGSWAMCVGLRPAVRASFSTMNLFLAASRARAGDCFHICTLPHGKPATLQPFPLPPPSNGNRHEGGRLSRQQHVYSSLYSHIHPSSFPSPPHTHALTIYRPPALAHKSSPPPKERGSMEAVAAAATAGAGAAGPPFVHAVNRWLQVAAEKPVGSSSVYHQPEGGIMSGHGVLEDTLSLFMVQVGRREGEKGGTEGGKEIGREQRRKRRGKFVPPSHTY